MVIFKNELVEVERRDDQICWYDLTDHNNDFKGFTQNKRGLDNATMHIKKFSEAGLNEETAANKTKENINMGDITHVMQLYKLRPHTYCGMD